MTDLKVDELVLRGNVIKTEMKTVHSIEDIRCVNMGFQRNSILTKKALLFLIDSLFDDLYSLKHEVEFGHLFDDLPTDNKKTEEEGGDTF